MISSYPIPLNIVSFIDNPNNNTYNISNFKHKIAAFSSFILIMSLLKKGKRDAEVSFSFPWMFNFLGNDLKKVIKTLEEAGFITKTRNYYVGSHCNYYKLNKDKCGEFKYFDLHHMGLPRCLKKTYFERIMEGIQKKNKEDLISIGKLADAEAYIRELDRDEETIEKKVENMEMQDKKTIGTKKESFRGAKNRYQWENFKAGNTFCTQSKVGGRLYTSFCNMSKEIKQHFSYKGKPIFNVDVKCAQPLILSVLYDEIDADPWFVKKEKEAYLQAVDDDIYTLIGAKGKDRDLIKKDFYNIFFGKLGRWNKELFKNFQENFPLLAEKIIQLKKKDHRTLAHKLQRTESDIVIHGAYLEFLETYDRFALTIHDSIVCVEEDIEIVKGLLSKHFARYGMKCSIGVERITV